MRASEDFIAIVNETIKKEQQKFEKADEGSGLLAANEFYNRLVKEGTIKKKGNTLREIGNSNTVHVKLNSL